MRTYEDCPNPVFFQWILSHQFFLGRNIFLGQSWSYCYICYCIHPSNYSWFEQLGLCLVFVFCQHKSHRFRFWVFGLPIVLPFCSAFLLFNQLAYISMRCSQKKHPSDTTSSTTCYITCCTIISPRHQPQSPNIKEHGLHNPVSIFPSLAHLVMPLCMFIFRLTIF